MATWGYLCRAILTQTTIRAFLQGRDNGYGLLPGSNTWNLGPSGKVKGSFIHLKPTCVE